MIQRFFNNQFLFFYTFYNCIGAYKRLTSGFEIKTSRKVINEYRDDIDNEYGSENKFDDKSLRFEDNNCDQTEARNEQMKRILHLQSLAGEAGEIPGR